MLISKGIHKEHLARIGGSERHTNMDVTSDRIRSCVCVCVCVFVRARACVGVERIYSKQNMDRWLNLVKS
jgi:hypothetical protein